MEILEITFNEGTQYITIHIDPYFDERYGEGYEGYFIPINKQAGQRGGLFGVILVPDTENIDEIVRHEAGHAAFHWVRVNGYVDSEEEAILVIQDEIMEGYNANK